MKPDLLKITILEDGTIKTETDAVSMPNHANAEAFLREVSRIAGGDVERKAKHGHAQHSHDAGQTFHRHEGAGH